MINQRYTKENYSAGEAQRIAHEIAFGPIVFQISRLMIKFGLFELLSNHKEGLTLDEIIVQTKLSKYAVKILLESSLTIGSVLFQNEKFVLSKIGWFLLKDEMLRVNMDFNHDVNYKGLFHLEEALLEGKPAGLKELGNWPTIYEGLSSLEKGVQDSWFAFDHFYSNGSFKEALQVVFTHQVNRLLDVGGNTGKWALECVNYDSTVEVTIADLPQQIEMMKKNTATDPYSNRIHGYGVDLLDEKSVLPKGFDVVWMSQFLDCFSEEEVVRILSKAKQSLSEEGRIFIMETLWDRQKFETASYDLTQISVYFTAMANGNGKMFYSEDLIEYIKRAGLEVEHIYDHLGYGHSILQCKR